MLIIGEDTCLGWSTGIFVHNHGCKSLYVGKLPLSRLQLLYPGPGYGGSSLSRDAQTFLAPDTSPQLFWEDSELLYGQSRDIVSPVYLGSSRVPVGHVWNTSLRKRPGDVQNKYQSNFSWLLSMWRNSCSTPSSSRVTELRTLSLKEFPAVLRRKNASLVSRAHPFCYYSKFIESKSRTSRFDSPRSSPCQTGTLMAQLSAAPIHLLVSCSIFPLHMNRRP